MFRLIIGAALAYAAFRIGREIVNEVPDIDRGLNEADFPAKKPARRRPSAQSSKPAT